VKAGQGFFKKEAHFFGFLLRMVQVNDDSAHPCGWRLGALERLPLFILPSGLFKAIKKGKIALLKPFSDETYLETFARAYA